MTTANSFAFKPKNVMKKVLLLSALFAFNFSLLTTVKAGGLVTNSNQNVSFLRQMSQDAIIDITGIYLNPAGTAFLKDGWHISANWQFATQSRDITTTFPLFAQNLDNSATTHKFEGNALAPVIPSLHVSYNKDKWSVNGSISLGGGGGKCEFDNGIGSFEAAYAGALLTNVPGLLPTMLQPGLIAAGVPAAAAPALAATATYDGYTMNSYMKGRQYYFGLSAGATYKFIDNLAGFGGLRAVFATCNYNGFVKPSIGYTVPAAGTFPGTTGRADLANYGIDLNCDQTGFGITPIIGIDYKINKHWNVAARFEAETKLRLKNKTEANVPAIVAANPSATALMGQFQDGTKIAANIPAILSAGAQYSPIEKVRIMAGWHYYFDKAAKQYNNKQDLIDKNTQEFSAGVEWDINKWVTLSGSWQNTRYGLSDQYMNDLSFNLSNNMVGGGVRVNPTEKIHIDLGYMHTFYKDKTVVTQTAAGQKTDKYHRSNRVFGIGVNIDF
jgi:long-chain fatty acid transport protein